jgi:heterodisulfide reductase subunit C
MIDFGYFLTKSGTIDLANADLSLCEELIHRVPSFNRCIGCGGCSATCTARQHTDFSILRCNFFLRRGEYKTLQDELDKCLLCGKCTLVCPRNVNIRAMIIQMRILLNSFLRK